MYGLMTAKLVAVMLHEINSTMTDINVDKIKQTPVMYCG